jgi:endonuclease G
MKKVFLVLCLLPVLAFSQKLRDSVRFSGPIFSGIYSEVYQQPLVLNYEVTCIGGTVSRSTLDFYKVDSIKTSDAADYAYNIYDKGHLAPAADFNCTLVMLKQTFSYLNCALQHEDLNRGMWARLEEFERGLAKRYGPLKVRVTVDFKAPYTKVKGGATIPTGFYKEIYIRKTKQTYLYYMPNSAPICLKLSDYRL